MSLLNDTEINKLLSAKPSLIDNFNQKLLKTPGSPVRGASLELTVGEIFLAGATSGELGSAEKPRTEISLEGGHTAVVRTKEKLHMPPDVAGIGFPPSTNVSLAGLLTTNPGLVDPNYNGYLHLTVVNMGSEVFALKPGDRILRLMLFKLDKLPTTTKIEIARPVVDHQLLSRLSPDFMDVNKRAEQIAQKVVADAEINLKSRQIWIPLVGTIVAAVFAFGYYLYSIHEDFNTRMGIMQGQLTGLISQPMIGSIDERLKLLKSVDERIRALELKVQTQTLPQSVPAVPQNPK